MSSSKSIFLCLALLFLSGIVRGQSSGKYLNYQAIARDDSGQPVANTQIRLRLRLIHIDTNGVSEQLTAETYRPRTDESGFFQVNVGQATGPDFLTSLDWGNGRHELNVEWDPAGGTDYRDLGSQELLPVPIALHALSVDNVDDADADPQNEFQYLEYDRESEILRLTTEPQDDVVIGGGINLPQPLFIRKGNTVLNNDLDPGQFVFGTEQPDYVPESERGSRFFFDREKAAFRAGTTFSDTISQSIFLNADNTEVWDQEFLGEFSFAAGRMTMASGNGSVAFGDQNLAGGRESLVAGKANGAFADNSVVLGLGNLAGALGQTTVGMYASPPDNQASLNTWRAQDPVFKVGNGTSFSERSSALTVLKNGQMQVNGLITVEPGILVNPFVTGQLVLGYQRIELLESGLGEVSIRPQRMELKDRFNSIWIGEDSGSSISSGEDNLGVGRFTAMSMESGFGNTFFGTEVGRSLIDGDGNSMVGNRAGQSLQQGSFNTFMGMEAGLNLSAGEGNTFIGRQAGRILSGGSHNTLLGHEAGESLQTGSGNILIGRAAGEDLTNESNRLFIDNNGRNADNALIYGEFDNEVLRINGSLGVDKRPSFGLNLDVLGDARVGANNQANGPSEFLAINGQAGTWFLNTVNTNSRAGSGFYISPNGSGPDGYFHLNVNGDAGFGTANPQADVHVVHGDQAGVDGLRIEHTGNSDNYWTYWVSNNTGRLFVFTKAAGAGPDDYVGVYNDETGEYFARSDRRIKKDIRPIAGVLPRLNDIPLYQYRYKHQKSESSAPVLGVMAQDLLPHFPELVMHDQENDTYLVNYKGLSVVALQAVQEQQQEIDDLKSRVAELERLVQLALSKE